MAGRVYNLGFKSEGRVRGKLKEGVSFLSVRLQHLRLKSDLFEVIRKGDIRYARYLLERGADVNGLDANGLSALHIAASRNNAEAARLLFEFQADPNIKESVDGSTPIQDAAMFRNKEVAEVLLENGADPNIKDRIGRTPISRALDSLNVSSREAFAEALLKRGADPNIKDNREDAPLQIASHRGETNSMKLLLEYGADPNIKDSEGSTPLQVVSSRGDLDSMRLLLEYGADPNVENKKWWTALHKAVDAEKIAAAKLLLQHGANPGIINNDGRTALQLASPENKRAFEDLFSMMKSAMMKFSAQGKRSFFDINLHKIVDKNELETVEALLQLGLNVDMKDSNGQTPIYYAAKNGHSPMVELLLKYGATPNVKDNLGKTPADVAKTEELRKRLRSYIDFKFID